MLRAEPMLKFRIIAPSEYEDRIVEALIRVGMVEIMRSEEVELAIPRELLLIANRRVELSKVDVDRVVSLINKLSGEATEFIRRGEALRSEIRKLERVRDALRVLAKLGLRTDSLGQHGFIFIIGGIIKKEYEEQISKRLHELRVAFNITELNERELLILISGLLRQQELVEKTLEELPFERLEMPQGLDPDPLKSFASVNYELQRLREELAELVSELVTQLKEASEREKTERLALYDNFLELYSKYRELVLKIVNLMKEEGLEVPNNAVLALERKVVAERIEDEGLVRIIKKYSEMISELSLRFEKLTSTLKTLKNVKERVQVGEIGKEVDAHLKKVLHDLEELAREAGNVLYTLTKYEPYIKALRYTKESILRLRIFRKHYVSIVSGWVPAEYAKTLELTVKKLVPRIIGLGIGQPTHEEVVPIQVKERGILKWLNPIIFGRDIPSYWEVDPTPFFITLFLIMYGMMFGDIGLGPLVICLGLIIYKMNRPLLGIPPDNLKTVGILMVLSGISSICFGLLYGVVFLRSFSEPILLSPLHDIFGIIKVALYFGVVQLMVALILNIVNSIIERDVYEIFLSGKGLAGLIYYISGVHIAMILAKTGFNWSSLLEGSNIIVTMIALSCMGIVILGPLYNFFSQKEDIGSCLSRGMTEFLEMLIAYPANSLSYIRLAAFAIAHEAFGLLADSLAMTIGTIPSSIIANLLVLGIEGFAAGIQAIRLVYYEFSTKFLRGGGAIFKPIKYEVFE